MTGKTIRFITQILNKELLFVCTDGTVARMYSVPKEGAISIIKTTDIEYLVGKKIVREVEESNKSPRLYKDIFCWTKDVTISFFYSYDRIRCGVAWGNLFESGKEPNIFYDIIPVEDYEEIVRKSIGVVTYENEK